MRSVLLRAQCMRESGLRSAALPKTLKENPVGFSPAGKKKALLIRIRKSIQKSIFPKLPLNYTNPVRVYLHRRHDTTQT